MNNNHINSFLDESNWAELEKTAIENVKTILINEKDVVKSFGIETNDIERLQFKVDDRSIHINSFGPPNYALSVIINGALELGEKMYFDPILRYKYIVDCDLQFYDEFLS